MGLIAGAAGAAASCAPQCVTTSSVTTMAGGTPPEPMPAADDIGFAGTTLTPPGAEAVKRLAQDALQYTKGMARKDWKLNVAVKADVGLSGAAAKAQIRKRQQTLVRALTAAGIEKCHINSVCKAPPRR